MTILGLVADSGHGIGDSGVRQSQQQQKQQKQPTSSRSRSSSSSSKGNIKANTKSNSKAKSKANTNSKGSSGGVSEPHGGGGLLPLFLSHLDSAAQHYAHGDYLRAVEGVRAAGVLVGVVEGRLKGLLERRGETLRCVGVGGGEKEGAGFYSMLGFRPVLWCVLGLAVGVACFFIGDEGRLGSGRGAKGG